MKKLITYLILMFGIKTNLVSQLIPQSTLYAFNPIQFNAGGTGNANALNISMSSRKMWTGVNGSPFTNYIAVHTPLKNEAIAIGGQILSDKIGVSRRTSIDVLVSYRIKIMSGTLSFGIGSGTKIVRNTWSEIITTDAEDDVFTGGDPGYLALTSMAGILYTDRHWTAGISIPNLLNETSAGSGKMRTSGSPDRFIYTLLISRKFDLNDKYFVRGSSLSKLNFPHKSQVDVTVSGGNDLIEMGFGFRNKDAWSALLRIKVNSQLYVNYAFDRPLSMIKYSTPGSHELMLSYTFLYQTKAPSGRFL